MSRKSWRAVKEIRIADVARLAGVSTATVSRVLSDPDKVRQKTHDVVMEAVRRSGYTPNSTAQNLRTRRTMNVLVVAPRLTNPVFAEILRGVDDELTQSGYGIIIGNLDNRSEREARYVDLALSRQVDGVLLLTGLHPRERRAQHARIRASDRGHVRCDSRTTAFPMWSFRTARPPAGRWNISALSVIAGSAISRARRLDHRSRALWGLQGGDRGGRVRPATISCAGKGPSSSRPASRPPNPSCG